MTAPNYPDKHEVNTLTLKQIQNMVTSERHDPITVLALAAISLWKERDSARGTAAMQDQAIHNGIPRTYAMEKCIKVLRWFANANEENHMDRCFWCSSHIVEEGHADPCGVVDAKKVLEELDKT